MEKANLIQSTPFFGIYGKIYTLSDKEGNVFYVGCSASTLEKRLRNHILEAKNLTRKATRKIEKIRSLDFEIVATIVELKWVTGRDRYELIFKLRPLEKKWITKYMNMGCALCNKEAQPKIIVPSCSNESVGQSISTVNEALKVVA